jgi:hypothetical protein
MKTSKIFAPALFLLAFAGALGVATLSNVGNVMAESAAHVVESVSVHANATLAADPQHCEMRDVEADEGYGVSRMEKRLICQ